LAEELLKNSLTYVGTLRKNRGEIPADMLPDRKRPIHPSLFGFHDKFTVVSYVPKVNEAVVLLSTLHHDQSTADDEQKKTGDCNNVQRNKRWSGHLG